jgi:hypothetical protein
MNCPNVHIAWVLWQWSKIVLRMIKHRAMKTYEGMEVQLHFPQLDLDEWTAPAVLSPGIELSVAISAERAARNVPTCARSEKQRWCSQPADTLLTFSALWKGTRCMEETGIVLVSLCFWTKQHSRA